MGSPRPRGLRATASHQWVRESVPLVAGKEQGLAARSQQGGTGPLPDKDERVKK